MTDSRQVFRLRRGWIRSQVIWHSLRLLLPHLLVLVLLGMGIRMYVRLTWMYALQMPLIPVLTVLVLLLRRKLRPLLPAWDFLHVVITADGVTLHTSPGRGLHLHRAAITDITQYMDGSFSVSGAGTRIVLPAGLERPDDLLLALSRLGTVTLEAWNEPGDGRD